MIKLTGIGLGILFIGLKLGNVIHWGWGWVLSPFWILLILWIIAAILMANEELKIEALKTARDADIKAGKLKSKWQQKLDEIEARNAERDKK